MRLETLRPSLSGEPISVFLITAFKVLTSEH